jgi:large subunit ribosomal protein L15
MQLHELQPIHYNKDGKRIARGGKRGHTSGRGQKGQKSRSGHRIRPAVRDMIQRLPKLRGKHA